jgi:hypothetical protein
MVAPLYRFMQTKAAYQDDGRTKDILELITGKQTEKSGEVVT